ncbi:MAG: hypothetical protein LBC67_04235 [Spirochaetales bacterium]|jgi:hypothetical protein|nr:hypothetical protein [Spirochaetales bacterium]
MRKTKTFLRVSFMLLALSGLLFAGCSSSSDDDPPQTAPVKPISGITVYDANGDAYSGENINFTKVLGVGQGGEAVETFTALGLTGAQVKVTDKKLTVNLGTQPVANGKLGAMPEDRFTVNPPSARFYEIYEFKNDTSSKKLELLKVEGGNVKGLASPFYTSEAVSVNGLSFIKGWNWLMFEMEGDGSPYVGNPMALGFKWYIDFDW